MEAVRAAKTRTDVSYGPHFSMVAILESRIRTNLLSMSQFKYKSSVLRCHDSEDYDCVTCRFLSGDESREVLLGVISNLDHMLFEKESLAIALDRIKFGGVGK